MALKNIRLPRLFGVERSIVTKHLKSIFDDSEIEESSTCANFAQTADDGKVTHEIAKAFAESNFVSYKD